MARIILFHPNNAIAEELQTVGFHPMQSVANKDIMQVVKRIFNKTKLNVMLQHNGTEDSIIWVDSDRFRQR